MKDNKKVTKEFKMNTFTGPMRTSLPAPSLLKYSVFDLSYEGRRRTAQMMKFKTDRFSTAKQVQIPSFVSKSLASEIERLELEISSLSVDLDTQGKNTTKSTEDFYNDDSQINGYYDDDDDDDDDDDEFNQEELKLKISEQMLADELSMIDMFFNQQERIHRCEYVDKFDNRQRSLPAQ